MKKKNKIHSLKGDWEKARWFELVERFDPTSIQGFGTQKERVFAHGEYENILILEAPKDINPHAIQAIAEQFQRQGKTVVLIPKGVRAVKLRMCSPEESRALEAQKPEWMPKAKEDRCEEEAQSISEGGEEEGSQV